MAGKGNRLKLLKTPIALDIKQSSFNRLGEVAVPVVGGKTQIINLAQELPNALGYKLGIENKTSKTGEACVRLTFNSINVSGDSIDPENARDFFEELLNCRTEISAARKLQAKREEVEKLKVALKKTYEKSGIEFQNRKLSLDGQVDVSSNNIDKILAFTLVSGDDAARSIIKKEMERVWKNEADKRISNLANTDPVSMDDVLEVAGGKGRRKILAAIKQQFVLSDAKTTEPVADGGGEEKSKVAVPNPNLGIVFAPKSLAETLRLAINKSSGLAVPDDDTIVDHALALEAASDWEGYFNVLRQQGIEVRVAMLPAKDHVFKEDFVTKIQELRQELSERYENVNQLEIEKSSVRNDRDKEHDLTIKINAELKAIARIDGMQVKSLHGINGKLLLSLIKQGNGDDSFSYPALILSHAASSTLPQELANRKMRVVVEAVSALRDERERRFAQYKAAMASYPEALANFNKNKAENKVDPKHPEPTAPSKPIISAEDFNAKLGRAIARVLPPVKSPAPPPPKEPPPVAPKTPEQLLAEARAEAEKLKEDAGRIAEFGGQNTVTFFTDSLVINAVLGVSRANLRAIERAFDNRLSLKVLRYGPEGKNLAVGIPNDTKPSMRDAVTGIFDEIKARCEEYRVNCVAQGIADYDKNFPLSVEDVENIAKGVKGKVADNSMSAAEIVNKWLSARTEVGALQQASPTQSANTDTTLSIPPELAKLLTRDEKGLKEALAQWKRELGIPFTMDVHGTITFAQSLTGSRRQVFVYTIDCLKTILDKGKDRILGNDITQARQNAARMARESGSHFLDGKPAERIIRENPVNGIQEIEFQYLENNKDIARAWVRFSKDTPNFMGVSQTVGSFVAGNKAWANLEKHLKTMHPQAEISTDNNGATLILKGAPLAVIEQAVKMVETYVGLVFKHQDDRRIDLPHLLDQAMGKVAPPEPGAVAPAVRFSPPPSLAHVQLAPLVPLTPGQGRYQWVLDENDERCVKKLKSGVVVVEGEAGTGKTYAAVHHLIRKIVRGELRQLFLTRHLSNGSKKIGAVPGEAIVKLARDFGPFIQNIVDVLSADDESQYHAALKKLDTMVQDSGSKLAGFSTIEMQPQDFLVGATLKNAGIILDDAQYTFTGDLKNIMTRAGDNSQLVICGSLSQIQRPDLITKSFNDPMGCGFAWLLDRIFRHPEVTERTTSFVSLGVEDIVRSAVAHDWASIIRETETGAFMPEWLEDLRERQAIYEQRLTARGFYAPKRPLMVVGGTAMGTTGSAAAALVSGGTEPLGL